MDRAKQYKHIQLKTLWSTRILMIPRKINTKCQRKVLVKIENASIIYLAECSSLWQHFSTLFDCDLKSHSWWSPLHLFQACHEVQIGKPMSYSCAWALTGNTIVYRSAHFHYMLSHSFRLILLTDLCERVKWSDLLRSLQIQMSHFSHQCMV